MYSNVGSGFTGDASSDPRQTTDDSADLLDDPHCRHLLAYLRREDGPVAEETLARHVVARITETPPAEVDDEVARRVQTWFHHGQLPALDAHGAVDFDPEAGEVRLDHDDSL